VRKLFAGAATAAAAAGVVALGLAVTPAQASAQSSAALDACTQLSIILNDFHVLDTVRTGGRGDSRFDRADAQAVAQGKGNPSPLLRDVARELVNNRQFFVTLDTAGTSKPSDGIVSRNDVNQVKSRNCL